MVTKPTCSYNTLTLHAERNKMTVTWVLERDVFSEECFYQMVEHFKANNIPYHIVKIIPFIHEIQGKVPEIEGPVVIYGSIGIQKLAERHNWKPGIWTGEKFSEKSLIKNIGKQALNNDMVFCKLKDVLTATTESIFFIKPNSDTKDFAGTVMEREDFQDWLDGMLASGYVDQSILETEVGVSRPVNIGCEWRFVVVNGEISSCSYYKQYQRVMPERGATKEVYDYAQWIAWQFENPASVFVMDIAEITDRDYSNSSAPCRVIEYNTFNSAGLYKADVAKVIDDINILVERLYNV